MYPTPTPLPPAGPPLININAADWRIWNYTDDAVQVWNRMGDATLLIQWSIIVVMVIGFVFLMMVIVRSLQSDGGTE